MPSRAARDIDDTADEHPLSDYITAFQERQEVSSRQLAKRAVDPETGQRLRYDYILALTGRMVPRAPELWRFRALAAAMSGNDLPGEPSYREHLERMRWLAAAQWLGISEVSQIETSSDSIITVSVPTDLTEDERREVTEWAERTARGMSRERDG